MKSKQLMNQICWSPPSLKKMCSHEKVNNQLIKPVGLPVVVKALELNDKGGGEPLDAQSLHRVPLLGAFLTEICVVPLQELSLHVLTEVKEKI